MSKRSNGFHFRSFISLLLFLSFSFSAFSGLVLFLRPEGSLANWHGWSVLGMDKKQWEGVHAVLVLVFFIAALVHLIYNWKVLAANVRRKKTRLERMFRAVGLDQGIRLRFGFNCLDLYRYPASLAAVFVGCQTSLSH